MINDGKKSFADYFRKRPEPKELVRKWQADIRTQQRALERQIRCSFLYSLSTINSKCYCLHSPALRYETCRDIGREEQKAVQQCKEAAKRGDVSSAKVIAKELVHTRKTIGHLHVNKAHMISMNAQLTEQLGVVKVAGTLSKSTQASNPLGALARSVPTQQGMCIFGLSQ